MRPILAQKPLAWTGVCWRQRHDRLRRRLRGDWSGGGACLIGWSLTTLSQRLHLR